ncbi:MAG: hypothetical protein WCI71_10910 [Bacteroidota bacterium]
MFQCYLRLEVIDRAAPASLGTSIAFMQGVDEKLVEFPCSYA